jgi:DNA (cytosine-5)-methyltransferase 1
LIFVGGIESNMRIEKNKQFSRNYKQGYRVYSSDGIACSITVNGGGLGGSTGLYIIDE